ncbi:MAG: aminoglycoside phosphotransferase family protein [Rhodoferax sp.]
MSDTPDSLPPPADHGTPNAPLAWADPQREQHFLHWLQALAPQHGLDLHSVRLASADASFRRYLRVDSPQGSRIVMDAPPEKENCAPFVAVDRLMAQAGLRVPEILDWNEAQGFMLMSDLGSHTLMQTVDPQGTPPLDKYLQAVEVLIAWQRASQSGVLPAYDEALLRRELGLFPEWYVGRHKGVALNEAQSRVLEDAFARIVRDNLSAPSVYVHRDFMLRNLMLAPGGQALGVLDFQDAVYGPISYDIASLVRDAFVSWDESFCLDVVVRYWQQARKAGLPVDADFGAFYRSVEWMGLQRHLKVAGIFARLTLRDGKPRYLADAPRFIAYIRATCARYIELKPLLRLVENLEGIEAPSGYAFGRV